jgi:hypothetical protein
VAPRGTSEEGITPKYNHRSNLRDNDKLLDARLIDDY